MGARRLPLRLQSSRSTWWAIVFIMCLSWASASLHVTRMRACTHGSRVTSLESRKIPKLLFGETASDETWNLKPLLSQSLKYRCTMCDQRSKIKDPKILSHTTTEYSDNDISCCMIRETVVWPRWLTTPYTKTGTLTPRETLTGPKHRSPVNSMFDCDGSVWRSAPEKRAKTKARSMLSHPSIAKSGDAKIAVCPQQG